MHHYSPNELHTGWRFAKVTDEKHRPIVVEILMREGTGLSPESTQKFEAEVYKLLSNMYYPDERPPIEVLWSKELLRVGKPGDVDVAIRFLSHKIAGTPPFVAIDLWRRILSSMRHCTPYFVPFRLGIVVIDKAGQPITRLGRSAFRRFSTAEQPKPQTEY